MTTLYLTADEKKLFDKLPEAARKGSTVEVETLTYEDSDEDREARMSNLELSNPELKKIQEQAKSKKFSQEEVAALAETVDLKDLSQDDMIELAFAWGPDVFTAMIAAAVSALQTPEEVKGLADLTNIRHGLLLSLNREVA